jgi:hypothetical protein
MFDNMETGKRIKKDDWDKWTNVPPGFSREVAAFL